MVKDTEYQERAYTTSEVAGMLDIAVPTVRKYAQHLEQAGYVFVKGKGTGSKQARLFLEKDITALRYLKQLREKSNIKVSEAVSIIIEKFGKGAIQPVMSNDTLPAEPHKEQYVELKEMIQQQNDMIAGLTKKLDEQQQYIDKRLNERDQALMQRLDQSIETQKQIAATQENKSIWAKLFRKQ